MLSGLSAKAHKAYTRSGVPESNGPDTLMGYQHGQAITLKKGMFCIPLRDSKATGWFAASRDAGLSITINSLKGLLTSRPRAYAAFEITLWDNHKGIAVEGATVRLFARMPHHDRHTPGGHGPSSDPDVRGLSASPSGEGRYTVAPVAFSMHGAWLFEVRVQHGSKTQRAYFATLVDD